MVQELDRVLDRENVGGARAVDLVDQRGEGGRLPRAGRPGDEHEAAGPLGELVEALRKGELLEGLDLLRDQPERGADAALGEEDFDAETGEPRDLVGDVDLAVDLESLLLLGREHPVEELLGFLGGEWLEILDREDLAADPDSG